MKPLELRRLPLFEPMSEAQLGDVIAHMQIRQCSGGQMLFRQSDAASHFFLVREGAVKLYLLSRDGGEKVVEIIQPGQLFAEAVMFMDARRYPVNAEALADTRLAAFDIVSFLAILDASPGLAMKLLGSLSRRIHELLGHIDALSLHNASFRLVSYLLSHSRSEADAVHLGIPKQVIASRLSMKPETLSRTLARLRQDGLIDVRAETILLLDEARLRAMLEE